MIWLTWRQFRGSALVVLGALAAAAIVLVITGPQLSDLFREAGEDFFARLGLDGPKQAVFYLGTGVVYGVPAVIGVFWGAPMIARELEAGTSRLVWTQSITRSRWLATKLGVTAAGAAVSGLSGVALTWWCAPIDHAVAKGYSDPGLLSVPRLWPQLFGARGVVPIGMAVLALAIGVTAGLVVRRSVPAMALTLVLVGAVQIVMPLVVQAHLLGPKQLTTTITQEKITELSARGEPGSSEVTVERMGISIDKPGAWITYNRTLDPSGAVADPLPAWTSDCAAPPGQEDPAADACFTRLADEGYRQRVEYQPADRFWPLQLIETGILLGLAGLLTGFCFWRIRRDLT
jgi:ABC-2 family transporter protein